MFIDRLFDVITDFSYLNIYNTKIINIDKI